MNPKAVKLSAGLYFVATPIGTARDITLRALDILASADVLAAEDTRSLRRLMDIHGIAVGDRPLIAYHDHNGDRARPRLMAALEAGKSVAYASEAGTPLIADPGYDLSRAAAADGYLVTSAPGPTAIATALTLAGLPTDRFFFAGFLPNSKSARKIAIEKYISVPGTLVFYESPKRITAMLADCAKVLGGDRQAAMCRELTKKFEEVRRGTLDELAASLAEKPVKGEIVVLVDRAKEQSVNPDDLDTDLKAALQSMSVRDAAETVGKMYGLSKRQVYQRAIALGQDE